jgi:hypothetical protein
MLVCNLLTLNEMLCVYVLKKFTSDSMDRMSTKREEEEGMRDLASLAFMGPVFR